jgi:Pentapeptide repeats (8 copies)
VARTKSGARGEASGRFGEALRLLGDVDVRLGGIYVLERVAQDAPQLYHGPMVEVLTAYIRGHAPWPPVETEPTSTAHASKRRPSADVQAALSVLGRRNRDRDDKSIQLRLSDVDLRGAYFRGGHFEGARLRRANLEGAHFEGAHLQGAKLRGANLRRADLGPDAELGFGGANLEGAHLEGANFEDAKLTGANLRGVFCDAATKWPQDFHPEQEGVVVPTHAATRDA